MGWGDAHEWWIWKEAVAYFKLDTGETEEEYEETFTNSRMHVKTIFVPSLKGPKLTFDYFYVGKIWAE
jgi:hypothetical protein